jgi:hypothetical protein
MYVTLSICKPSASYSIHMFKGRYCTSTLQNKWMIYQLSIQLVKFENHNIWHATQGITYGKSTKHVSWDTTDISWPGIAGAWMHPGTCHEWVNNYVKATDHLLVLPFPSKYACSERVKQWKILITQLWVQPDSPTILRPRLQHVTASTFTTELSNKKFPSNITTKVLCITFWNSFKVTELSTVLCAAGLFLAKEKNVFFRSHLC